MQKLLNLSGINVFTSSNNHIFHSAGDPIVTFFIAGSEVSTMKPAIFIDNFFSFFRHLIVPFHYIVPTATNFPNSTRRRWFIGTRVNDSELYSRERLTYGFSSKLNRIVNNSLGHTRGASVSP